METEKILIDKIMAITQKMNENCPEIAKYISEMPSANPDESNPDINIKNLREYYDSLIQLLKKYKQNHLIPEAELQHG